MIVGAHLDHLGRGYFSSRGTPGLLHLGADDNASGTAAVLELALSLAAHPDLLPQNTNVLFLHFDAEERGLIGSRFFTTSGLYRALRPPKASPSQDADAGSDRTAKPLPRAEAMINLDMVGRLRSSKGLMLQGCETADPRWADLMRQSYLHAFGSSDEQTKSSAKKRNPQDATDPTKKTESAQSPNPTQSDSKCSGLSVPQGPNLRLIRGGSGPSDHSPFYRKGLPIAFFFTGSHLDYHTERDLPERINYIGLLRIVRMAHRLVVGWSNLREPLLFRKAAHEARRSDFDFRLRLGIVPGSYESGKEGLLVAAVKQEAPVAKSGLRAGDTIVRIGAQPIGDINDLMEFLSNASSKRVYELHYKRNGKLHKTKTRLMAK